MAAATRCAMARPSGGASWPRLPGCRSGHGMARDGTATWSLTMLRDALLRDALRRAEDGLPGISTYTIGRAPHAAGYSWQKGRSWCETGVVVRRRRHEGLVTVADPDAAAKRG